MWLGKIAICCLHVAAAAEELKGGGALRLLLQAANWIRVSGCLSLGPTDQRHCQHVHVV